MNSAGGGSLDSLMKPLDLASLGALLNAQGVIVDRETLAPVERWYLAWFRDWQVALAYPVGDILPAPLFCWPP